MNIQLTAKGQEHIRKIVDMYMPQERNHLDEHMSTKYGIDTTELPDDELYMLCEEKGETGHIWYSLCTLWEI
jgi:hypothetical protein